MRTTNLVAAKERWDKLRIRTESLRRELKQSKKEMESEHGTSEPDDLKKIKKKYLDKISECERRVEKIQDKIEEMLKKYDS